MTETESSGKLGSNLDITDLDGLLVKRRETRKAALPNRKYKPYAMSKMIKSRRYWYIYQAVFADGKRKLKMLKYCGKNQPTKKEVESHR